MKEVSVVAVSLPGRAVDVWHANKASVPALPDLEGALTVRVSENIIVESFVSDGMSQLASHTDCSPCAPSCCGRHRGATSIPYPPRARALQTRPPHFFFLVSPSFPLEAFTRVLDNAFPSSSKAACRAFSGMELTDEIANSVRIVQPSGGRGVQRSSD